MKRDERLHGSGLMTDASLAQLVRDRMSGQRAARALLHDGIWTRWDALADFAGRLDDALSGDGIGSGCAGAVIARNTPGAIAAVLALFATGRPVAIVSPIQSPERIAADITRLAPSALLACEADLVHAVVREAASASGAACYACSDAPALALRRVARGRNADPAGNGYALEMLTSGTTGTPKRIGLRGDTIVASGLDQARIHADLEPRPADRETPTILFQPIANISGMYFLQALAVTGRAIIALDRFTVPAWLEHVRRERPSWLWLPPAAIRQVVEAGVPRADLACALGLRTGSAPLDAVLRRRFEADYGVPILGHYGATEFCGLTTALTLEDRRRAPDTAPASVGRARPGIGLRIVDQASGEALPAGDVGLLELMAGRIGPAWMRTTDLASLDASGLLFLHGRADDAINRGGFKIDGAVVEAALRQHPGVSDVIVIGLADERLGQVPVAAIETRSGMSPPTAVELEALCRAQLLAYQVPARFIVLDTLPRTPTMKISRHAVVALFDGGA